VAPEIRFDTGPRLISLRELCEWLSITERHARKLIERDAIPYRKVGHLLRFSVTEIEQWSIPPPRKPASRVPCSHERPSSPRARPGRAVLPKSLID
jgi:excisionase family DNA binding protein